MVHVKSIAVIIGDYFHEGHIIKDAIEAALGMHQLGSKVQLHLIPVEQIMDMLSSKPDAVILFKENRLNPADAEIIRWMSEDVAQEIERYVQAGGTWLAWHAGLASYNTSGAYITLLKGHFITHPKKHSEVYYTVVENSLGITSMTFTLVDEHYFVACHDQHTHIFMRSASVDGESVAGWYHEYGKGKVCCLTPAHTREGLMNEHLVDILGTIIKWMLA